MAQVRCPVVCGRDAELRTLDSALASARLGRGGLLLLTGAPGIGKSRLAGHLVERAAGLGLTTAVGRAVPAGADTPYGPLTQALLQILRDRPMPDDPSMGAWLGALTPVVPIAGELGGGDASPTMRGEAVLQLLRRLAEPSALVVLLEDLHWSDPDTLAVVEYVSDALASERLLWVATLRDEPASAAMELAQRLRDRRGVTHLALERLGEDDIARMVGACLPHAAPEVVARVQRTADGVPLFVEEILASPGVPDSFTAAVETRLAGLDVDDRHVLDAAAVLGRHFDWRLLPVIASLPAERVWAALERGASCSLLTVDGDRVRFRHALTREALVDRLLPPRRAALASAALTQVEAAHPHLADQWREVAAGLAVLAGDRHRAGLLLTGSGLSALEQGALATAVDTLSRAAELLSGRAEVTDAELALVRALALAGHVDQALGLGERLVAELESAAGPDPTAGPGAGADPARDRLDELRLALAQAAVTAQRWEAAAGYLQAVRSAKPTGTPALWGRATALAAEVAFARDRGDEARRLVDRVLGTDGVGAENRCHAFELLGRIQRLSDLGAARDAFERALSAADAAHLPLRRLQALHELGTIEMFEHAGSRRLTEARAMAQKVGALATVAVLDLQLTAVFLSRFAPAEAERHARASAELGERLRLDTIRAKALGGLAETYVQRRDPAEMERHLTLAAAAAPDDRGLHAMAWGQCRGLLAFFEDDWPTALECFERGIALMQGVGHPEPVEFRAMWPLLLAADSDRRARPALLEARRPNLTIAFANRGLLGYAEAILAGREGDTTRATELARGADAYLARFPVWADLARVCAAGAAQIDGWGAPRRWLEAAAPALADHGLDPLVARCRRLLDGWGRAGPAGPGLTPGSGITAREGEVLGLLAEGLANKQIGTRLHLSPRTVEKHVESLLRKTGTHSRTQLAAAVAKGEITYAGQAPAG